jgi:hypothetical protein
MPILGVTASSISGHLFTDTGVMFPIGMVQVGSAGASTVSFSSIPSTYTHLQIRIMSLNSSAASDYKFTFNSDTGANYSKHSLYGSGASAASGNEASASYIAGGLTGSSTNPGVGITDILEYKNTNIYKTVRSLQGYDTNGSGGYLFFTSGSWRNTNAITSITITPYSGTINQYSSFALYGIKGA